MDDKKKLKQQLLHELTEARRRLSDMERLLHKQRDINKALRKTEKRYRNLVENTSDWIWETDTKHCFVYTNNRIKDILGYEPEDILGKPPTTFMTREEADRVQTFLDELLSAPQTFCGLESKQRHKDGATRYLDMNIIPLFSVNGTLAGFRGITRDITARKKMEEALQVAEERFRLVSQAANDAIYDWDIGSGTLWLSESHREFLGFPAKDDHFHWWKSRLHPDDRERILANLRSMLKGLTSVWMDEYRFLSAEGRYINIIDRGQILRDEKGAPRRIVGSMMDATSRKLAEVALLTSEENYRRLIEESPIGIIVYAPNRGVVMSNRRAQLLLGVSESQLLGRQAFHPDWAFLRDDGSPITLDEHPVNKVMTTNTPIQDKIYGVVRPNSPDTNWYLVSVQPQHDKTGQIIRIILSLIDITEAIRIQRALMQSEAKYRFLTEKMSDIVWTLDNDLRFTYISPSIQRTLDYRQDELLSLEIRDFMTPESYVHAKDIMTKELIRDQQIPPVPNRSIIFDTAFIHRDGSVVWLENAVSFIREESGRISGIYGVSRNITGQKIAAEEKERLFNELKQALSEVKTLSGLLPICSNCKKIRDDKGYWNQLEGYISEHTDALFSHGICPECAEKLYPGYFAKKKP